MKRYGDKIKVTLHRKLRRKGIEYEGKFKVKNRCRVNENKLYNNICRAKSKIKEYILCNDFKWFVTFTISPDKFDRYNLETYYKDFSNWLYNINKRRLRAGKPKIRYLSIPEQHKDGAWHLHSVLEGLEIDDITRFTYENFPDGKIPKYIKQCLDNDEPIYYWKEYSEKYGYVTIRPIQSKEKVANYIVKYLSKDIENTSIQLNKKLYYCSKGLKKAEEIVRGRINNIDDYSPQYENEYVKVCWYNEEDEKIKNLITRIHYSLSK